jgi:hypothetical protein
MGACCNNKVVFGILSNKNQMLEQIKEEKKVFTSKVQKLKESIDKNNQELCTKSTDEQTQLKLTISKNEKTIKFSELMTKTFDEIEQNLNERNHQNYNELGNLLDTLIDKIENENEPDVNLLKGKIREWLSKNN